MVEGAPVRVCEGGRGDAAADVGGLARGMGPAAAGGAGAGEVPVRGQRAFPAGVQGHGVAGHGVDAFDDVDFARRRPVGAEEPEGGPYPADAAWHVLDVGYE